ncbi:Phyllocladan-16-alpha-ol synthase [Penicillium odoratum]|uniref:Phyllocladan-16-alpha-ol synthase n=1 Tax=Penicillium odoratum TaxID=1167516 RepID=UPI002546C921|nr:Phyllocladan-16-alpha-ol synthase [Penicillium odoratum]KAJ5753014.1 Phyllocladan-16-alpha-ol synthase [Penicillium odoratum]
MDPVELHYSAAELVNKLTEHIEGPHGLGFMSPAIYDTAWVSMVQKSVGEHMTWLFPDCFEYILHNQLEDGSWITYASQIDGILNTAASLLSLKRHFNTPFQSSIISQDSLEDRIEQATNALQALLQAWDVDSTLHVGFEILVPALLGYLEAEGIAFFFPGHDRLFEIRDQKLARFKPAFLYAPVQTTALHSLEAFIGLIDFDRVRHHKVNGAFMASPSSTAAVLMHASEWDEECEQYLYHVIQNASGKGSGGVPSAFPSTIFEMTWTLSTLLKAGFDLNPKSLLSVQKASLFLHNTITTNEGTMGFVPLVCADADDTAKTILVLNLLQQQVSPDAMLKAFEADYHFKTYPHERDASFSANCNVLLALLHTHNPSQYEPQIEKATRFLHTHFRESELNVRDKWNLSPLYSWMLMTQAITRLYELWQTFELLPLKNTLGEDLCLLLRDMTISVLHQQNQTGSWGTRGSKEETAYAVLILTHAVEFKFPDVPHLQKAICDGYSILCSETLVGSERLWVEKVTYESEVLTQAYTLAALKSATDLRDEDVNEAKAPLTNGMNGHLSEAHEAQRNGTNGLGTHTPKINGTETQATVPDMLPDAVTIQGRPNGEHNSDSMETRAFCETRSTSFSHRPKWTDEQEKILLGPFDYLEALPGKNMRAAFIQAFNTWLQVPLKQLQIVEKVISMLHTASLLVDDIEDNSQLRRGQPVAHSIFGAAQTFNSGNYVYFLALREIQKLNSPRAIEIYVDALIHLHRGQGMDVFWRDSLICPTEEEYLDMVSNKTGALFCLAIELLQIDSAVEVDLVPLVKLFGIIFQISDDYLNLKSPSYLQKKGLCEDLTEGKFSFPIIHSIRSNPTNRQLINVLKQKPQDEDIKRYAVAYMESTNTFEYTREFVASLKIEALNMIGKLEKEGLGENLAIRKILARMSVDE